MYFAVKFVYVMVPSIVAETVFAYDILRMVWHVDFNMYFPRFDEASFEEYCYGLLPYLD